MVSCSAPRCGTLGWGVPACAPVCKSLQAWVCHHFGGQRLWANPAAGVLYGPASAPAGGSARSHDSCGVPPLETALTGAEQLAAAKLSRRRQQLQAAAEEQEPPRREQQEQAAQQERGSLQGPAPPVQAAGVATATAAALEAERSQQQQQQQAGQQTKVSLSPALQREVAAAAAAIAAVGGGSSRKARLADQGQRQLERCASGLGAGPGTSAPLRPLIRRRALGGRSSLQQMAGGSRSGRAHGGDAGGRPQQAGRRPRTGQRAALGQEVTEQCEEEHAGDGCESGGEEDEAYRARLPTSTQPWLEAQARQAAEDADLQGSSGRRPAGRQPGAAGPGSGDEDERRSSPIVEISLLLAECVQHGLRTIAFCKSRWVRPDKPGITQPRRLALHAHSSAAWPRTLAASRCPGPRCLAVHIWQSCTVLQHWATMCCRASRPSLCDVPPAVPAPARPRLPRRCPGPQLPARCQTWRGPHLAGSCAGSCASW